MSGTSSLQPQEEGLTLFFCEAAWATVIAYIVCRVSRTALKSSRSFSYLELGYMLDSLWLGG